MVYVFCTGCAVNPWVVVMTLPSGTHGPGQERLRTATRFPIAALPAAGAVD